MGRGGYGQRTGQALSGPDLRQLLVEQRNENQLQPVTIDLTVARSNEALNLSGTSLYIADIGGADWSMRLSSPLAGELRSSYFATGTSLLVRFTEIYFTNAAAAAGTAPLILIVGRYG